MTIHANLRDAFTDGYAIAPCGIEYIQGKGWRAYDLTKGAEGIPEFLIHARAKLPIFLSDVSGEAFYSLVNNTAKG